MTVATSLILALCLAACSGGGASSAPSSAPSSVPEAPGGPVGFLDPTVATACAGLGAQDCERARAMAASILEAGDPPATYVQVGPFGCATGDRCPTTLTARPEGDVVIEFAPGEGINVHLKVAPDGSFAATRDAAMGVAVDPASAGGIPAGPFEFSLGHCGIFSGVDLDGSWWDPVGPIPMDSGEAVNATVGILTLADPDHATFTTPTGFALQLERRAGPKLLPFCM